MVFFKSLKIIYGDGQVLRIISYKDTMLTSNNLVLYLQVAGKKQFSLKSNFLLSKRKKNRFDKLF